MPAFWISTRRQRKRPRSKRLILLSGSAPRIPRYNPPQVTSSAVGVLSHKGAGFLRLPYRRNKVGASVSLGHFVQ
jgi:hypothetical protein